MLSLPLSVFFFTSVGVSEESSVSLAGFLQNTACALAGRGDTLD